MSTVRIIGVGSPLGLDRLGWEAVRGLAGRGLAREFPGGVVTLCTLDRPGSLLIEAWRHARAVVIIDAMQAGGEPGTVRRLTPLQVASRRQAFISSHDVGLPQALALAEALSALPEECIIYGIEIGTDFDPGGEAPLVPLRERALAQLYPRVQEDIRRWTASARPPKP